MKNDDWLDFDAYSARRQARREQEKKRQLREQARSDSDWSGDDWSEEEGSETLDLVIRARKRRLAKSRGGCQGHRNQG